MQPNTLNHPSGKTGLLTKEELAQEWNCSIRYIEQLMSRHMIPYIKLGPRFVRFRRSAIEQAAAKLETASV
jgi:excisionase family DNA binding protein